jgi:hydroxyacylglutathione hydrolase
MNRFAALVASLLFATALFIAKPSIAHPSLDVEAAKHAAEAAQYQIVDTYKYPGFEIIQFNLSVLSHYSYLLISEGEGLLVDPGRDCFAHLEAAKERGVKIKAIWLTHSHADFVAGHIEAAKRLDVPIYISAKAGAEYECVPLSEGDKLTVGAAVVTFLETPGHTPDSMCGLVASAKTPDKPEAIFTGDTLFVGSVGRPDLIGDAVPASSLASMMFDTWNDKLAPLPDSTVVLPAHGAGSLCGARLSDSPSSTIGEEKASNPYLQHKSRGDFVAAVLEGLPEAPQYFAHNAAMNRVGPSLVDWNPKTLPEVEPTKDLMDLSKHHVVDVRENADYAAGHIPGSINIALRGRLENWVGTVVPWEADLVLVGGPDELTEAVYRLHRVGYRSKVLPFEKWMQAKLPLKRVTMVPPKDLHQLMQSRESPLVVDVRLPSEWMAKRVGTVLNLPLNHLAETSKQLNRDQPIVTVCNSAFRSMMAAGILERNGFKNVSNLDGGGKAWSAAGLPVIEASPSGGTSSTPKREVRIADRLSAKELMRMIQDLPGRFQLVDIRPAAHFEDYRIPGSENVDLADLLENPAYQSGVGPLVVVDRDGSLAMMAAGILSQKTQRPIKALYGGLQAYWNEAGIGAATTPTAGSASTTRRTNEPAPKPVPAPKAGKVKSAGC